MPSNVDSPRPSARDCRNASSRLGPTLPFALARASVWQDEHLSENFSLPFVRFVLAPLSAQPDRAIAVATLPMTTRPLVMTGHPNRRRGQASRRLPCTDAVALLRGRGSVVRGHGELEPGDAAVRRLR